MCKDPPLHMETAGPARDVNKPDILYMILFKGEICNFCWVCPSLALLILMGWVPCDDC